MGDDLNANAILGEPSGDGLVEGDDFTDARARELAGEDDSPIEFVSGTEARAHLYGKMVTVPLAATQQSPFSAHAIPMEARERDWTITVQQQNNPLNLVADTTIDNVIALISYGQGQARFTAQLTLVGQARQKLTVSARYVEVSFFYFLGHQNAPSVVSVSIVPGRYQGPDFYAYRRYEPIAGTAADHVLLTPTGVATPGVLARLQATLWTVQAAGTALWPLLFDTNLTAAPVGLPVIRGGRLPAVKNIGDESSLTDGEAPGSIQWNNGLMVALSTRPDQYNAPVAGNTFWADLKAGS